MSEENNHNIELYTAILEVMKKVGYVEMTGEMKGRIRYKYASETDLLNALRPEMIKHGIIMLPVEVIEIYESDYSAGVDSTWNHIRATHGFKIIHAETGQFEIVRARGDGGDPGDKAAYKEATGALKYALRHTFLIPTGDDPDQTSSYGGEESTTKSTNTKKRRTSRKKSSSSPPKKEEKKAPPPENQKRKSTKAKAPTFDAEAMNRAMKEYEVPEGIPLEGQTLGQAMKDEILGPAVIGYLAGEMPSGSGEMFEPTDEDDISLKKAAKYIYFNNPTFIKALEKFKQSVE